MWPGATTARKTTGGKTTKDIIADFQGTDEVFARKQASSGWNRSFQRAYGTRLARSSVDLVGFRRFGGILTTIFHPGRYKFEIATPIPYPSRDNWWLVLTRNFKFSPSLFQFWPLKFTRLEKISSFSLLFDDDSIVELGNFSRSCPRRYVTLN